MAGDVLENIFKNALQKRIHELTKQGMTETEILQMLNQKKIDNTISKLIEQATQDQLSLYQSKAFEISSERRASAAVFIAHQEEKWGKCFALSDAMYVLATEFGEAFGEYVEENVDESRKNELMYTFLCLQHIHGRACQEFLEILYLIKLGFADGASARWRSMYELSCISWFIREQGEQIAKQYWEQSQTYDKSYAWTNGAKNKNGETIKIGSFADIQRACTKSPEWKEQYRLACFVNHASPQGTFKRLANMKPLDKIPCGHSDYGIDTPAIHAAISLTIITNLFLNLFPHGEGVVHCKVMNAWTDLIRERYTATRQELFQDSEEAQPCPTSIQEKNASNKTSKHPS